MQLPIEIKSQLERAEKLLDELELEVKKAIDKESDINTVKNVVADLSNKLRSVLDL